MIPGSSSHNTVQSPAPQGSLTPVQLGSHLCPAITEQTAIGISKFNMGPQVLLSPQLGSQPVALPLQLLVTGLTVPTLTAAGF